MTDATSNRIRVKVNINFMQQFRTIYNTSSLYKVKVDINARNMLRVRFA